MRASLRVDRDAGGAQRLHVPVDRPLGDLELGGQSCRRQAAACLEEQEQLNEARGAHRAEDTRRFMT
jgi:hypothetical protein